MIFTPDKLKFYEDGPYGEKLEGELIDIILDERQHRQSEVEKFLAKEDCAFYPPTYYVVQFWVFQIGGKDGREVKVPGRGSWFPNSVTKDDILSGRDIEFHWLPEVQTVWRTSDLTINNNFQWIFIPTDVEENFFQNLAKSQSLQEAQFQDAFFRAIHDEWSLAQWTQKYPLKFKYLEPKKPEPENPQL